MMKVTPYWTQKGLIANYYKLRRSPDEHLLVWQMYWRGENFYTENEIFEGPTDERTVFLGDKNVENLKAWMGHHRGPPRLLPDRAHPHEPARGDRARPRARPSLKIVDESNMKFCLASDPALIRSAAPPPIQLTTRPAKSEHRRASSASTVGGFAVAQLRARLMFGVRVVLVGMVVVVGFGCGGSSGTGTGGSGGKAGSGGKGGSSATGTGGSAQTDASGAGGSSEAGASGTGAGGSSEAGAGGTSVGEGGVGGKLQRDSGSDAETTDARKDAAETDAHKDAAPDAKDAENDSGAPACINACTLGGHRCAGGGSEVCVVGSNGCTEWGPATSCAGLTTCSASTGLCACPAAPAGCTAAGKFCDDVGELVTCTANPQGCLSSSTPTACRPDESCKGALPNAACSCDNNPSCSGNNTFCLDDGMTVATCGLDDNTPACNVVMITTSCNPPSFCANGICACPAIGTTVGTGCATPNATLCAGTDILTCVNVNDAGCNFWQASTHCGDGGLTCGTKASATPACQCPENSGTDVYIDPNAGSDIVGGMFPTGIQSPAACRYASLTNGLTKVGLPGRVIAISTNLPATFAGETFPLRIPAGVTVMTADAVFNAADYVIDASTGGPAITLDSGSALEGFTVDAGGPAASLVSCSAGGAVLQTLVLDGKGLATDGIDVLGSCAPTIVNVNVARLTGTALQVTSTGSTSVTAGSFNTSSIGVEQTAGAVSLTSLSILDNSQIGVLVPGNAVGTPSLTMTGGDVVIGNLAGIDIESGALSASDLTVQQNTGGSGIQLNSGGAHQLSVTTVNTNGGFGVGLTSGSLTAPGLVANNNGSHGVLVSGGTLTTTGTILTQNGGRGLAMSGGTVSVTGGTLSGNALAGVIATGGTLTISGTELTANGTYGVHLTGATAVLLGANIHDNSGNGVLVNESNGATVNVGSNATVTTINHNGGSGILVDAAPATTGGANSVTVERATISGNSAFGIYLAGDDGSVAATIKDSSITGNGDVGLMVEQGSGNTTSEAIQNNDVSGNDTGNNHLVGGVLFNTSSTLTSFIGNKVHSNVGDELGFNAPPNDGPLWVINPPSAACDATANSLYCYGTGSVGLHVISAAAKVDAQHVHWTNNPPTSGIDFSGGAVVANPCTVVVATCP